MSDLGESYGSQPESKVEHLFRHEYGTLVAILVKRAGTYNLELIEDSVQHAMAQALHFWPRSGVPDNPPAWLYQVAYRQLLTELRNAKRRDEILSELGHTPFDDDTGGVGDIPLSSEMNDALLRLLFVTCHDALPVESQLVFTLKSLCGFSVSEIAFRLFISEANVYKRFGRAKRYLKQYPSSLQPLGASTLKQRMPMVLRVIYLIFTEGYLSSHHESAIRRDLCEEAIRLAKLLSHIPLGATPEAYALLALMYFNLARMPARQSDDGDLILLEQQDRSKWNLQHIVQALSYLARSAKGDVLSRYHLEASIAAEHCLSSSFETTAWENIALNYQQLERIAPSPMHVLNRAIAVAQWKGADAGIAILQSVKFPPWLETSYYWDVVWSDLSCRKGDFDAGLAHAKSAIEKAPTEKITSLILRRLARYGIQRDVL